MSSKKTTPSKKEEKVALSTTPFNYLKRGLDAKTLLPHLSLNEFVPNDFVSSILRAINSHSILPHNLKVQITHKPST